FPRAVILRHEVKNDRLVVVQMRKLVDSHSGMFSAPHEVDQTIRGLVAKENPSIRVTTHWAIQEAWDDIQRQAPSWAQRGTNHQSRYEV
ncbi:hypothetical protein EV363DRAFT_1162104, partial [Boletus edulis]